MTLNNIRMGGKLQPLSREMHVVTGVSATEVSVVDAAHLLGDAGELAILHGGETYRLTRTKQNKLLLTKCRNLNAFGNTQQLDSNA